MTNSFWLENLKRYVAGLLLLIAAAASATPLQAQVYGVTSYPVPSGAYGDSNIATATDGTLWFISVLNSTQYAANKIAANGAITQFPLSSTVPSPVGSSITTGPDGSLWFTAGGPESGAVLVKMSTKGVVTLIPITGNSGTFAYAPGAIVTGPDQNIWFTDSANSQLTKYTPSSNTFATIALTNPAYGITTGPDGNIWATEYLVMTNPSDPYNYLWSGSVAKVTPQGAVAEYAFPVQNVTIYTRYESPIDVFATGSDGALWFTEYDGSQVGRVSTSGVVTTPYVGFADGITAGPDGALWITQPNSGTDSEVSSSGPALVQLTTSGATTSYALGTAFSTPTGITVDSNGALWFDDSSASVIGQAILTLAITTTTLPNGSVGTAYNTTLQAEGGTVPYTWSVPATSLPPGLNLSSAGVISGTPTTTGTFTFTVTATDSASPAQTATEPLSITIAAGAPTTIVATSGSGQTAQVNTTFGIPLVATVTDSGGNPVPSASVTFTAPGSGASGTFTGGAITATVAANASGMATAPAFTANATAGSYAVSASVPGVAGVPFALANSAGAAGSITATSGGGQSAPIDSAFGSPLVATVLDAGGNPVPNASVTFSAPGAGASGTFAGGGTTAITTTNAAGMATSPTFTANAAAGAYSVTAALSGVTAAATFTLTNTAGGPASITATAGTPQSAQINSAFGSPLVVTVKDAGGNPIANVAVTFTAPGSGASGVFSGAGTTVVETTNAAGSATSPAFTANSIVGSYAVSASVAGVSSPAAFALTNTTGAPASIAVAAGNGQSAQINNTFGSPLVVTVKDSGGNLVPNASVTFAAPGSGASGTFSGAGATATVTTNAAGAAISPAFTANSTAGSYAVSATVAGLPAAFSLTNTAGAPASITATSGGGQNAQASGAFASPLVVTVKDSGGNVVGNASVTFTAPPYGASGTFAGGAITAIVQTNASGVGTSPTFTANGTAGSYIVNAAVTGVAAQAAFALTNTAGTPSSVTATSGGAQTAQIKTAFVNPLVVTVKDASGNPVPNVTVTFSTPGSGASATFVGGGTTASANTNSTGVATSPTLTANGTAGTFSASAGVNGVTPVTFALNNTAGAPGSIAATSGTGQFARVNTPFAFPLVVTVSDSNGNPVASATVTFTAPSTGPSGTFAGSGITATATTNSSGVATSPSFNANAIASPSVGYPVTASVPGAAAPVTFYLNNSAGVPASIAASSGGGQTARVNSAFNNPFVATVKDSGGNPVGSATVTFTAPGSPASGTFPGGTLTATAQTNSSGVATSPTFTANGAPGNYLVNAAVTGVTTQATFALTNVSGLTITTMTLPAGTAGLQYSVILASTAGTPPYNWTVSIGALAQGLTLNALTGAISGMPTASGTYPFTVKLTDSSTPTQTATQAFSLFINPPVTQPVMPTFTLNGVPSTQAPGTNITNATVQLSQVSSAAYAGALTLAFAPNTSVAGLPEGYLGDAGFVNSDGTKSTTASVSIPAATTSIPLPNVDPGTVAGDVTLSLSVGGETVATSTITVAAAPPTIEATSVQITGVTATGFDVELVATSTTRELTNATFTFTAAAGATISGTSTFTVDVSSLLSSWFASSNGLTYGGAFTLTLPFSLTGSASAIQSVSVTLSNSIGTSAAVSGTQ